MTNIMQTNNLENIIEYSIVNWKPLGKSIKKIVKNYKDAKNLFYEMSLKNRSILVYGITKRGNHINLIHLLDFKINKQ